MSFIYDSSKVKEKNVNLYGTTDAPKENSSSIQVFNNSLVKTEENNISKKQEKKVEYDTDALLKKYQKNPSKILDEIGVFDEKQRKELTKLLSDKKDLKAFLEIMQKDGLKAADMVSAMKKVAEKTTSGFFKRIGNVVKTVFKEGISEAVDLAKSEKVYYSEKLSGNMEEIRDKREDFSSEGLADIGDKVTQNKDLKAPTMHFVEQEELAGKKLYSEADVTKAVDIMYEKPADVKDFVANAKELEAIKDENGHVKYKGSTIINVDEKMINNKELQPTMMKTAKKADMVDEYLLGITDNLVLNPEMDEAINSFLDCKDKNGKDRFSAKNLFTQSTYMSDKDADTIASYQTNTLDLAKYEKLSGDNITSVSANITDHPETKSAVYQQINNSNYSGNDVEKYSSQISGETKSGTTNAHLNSSSNSNSSYTAKSENNGYSSNPIGKNTDANYRKDVTTNTKNSVAINRTLYSKNQLSSYFYRKYGSSGDMILRKLEENPSFVAMLKKYGNNKEILSALIKDPTLVDKITRLSASITTDQLGKIVKLCSSTEKTNIILTSIEQFGPQKAIMMAEKTTTSSENKDMLEILNKNTIDSARKKEQIQKIQDGSTVNKEEVA